MFKGGKYLGLQALNSPWDVVLFSVPDMDMSVRTPAFLLEQMPMPSGTEKGKGILFCVFLQNTVRAKSYLRF